MQKIIILEDVRSAHNVGSIFRTSAAFSVSKIFLLGTTPTPIDRFGRKRDDISKVSLGAENMITWEYFESISDLEHISKDISFIGIEQTKSSKDYIKYVQENDSAYIFGNERDGLSKTALNLCQTVLEIPLTGEKESLNVSVAAGIILSRV